VTNAPSMPNDSDQRQIRHWLLITFVVSVGFILRSLQAFEDRALWLDEAMLALNVRRLSLTELCGPLYYDQAAPVGFLWLQKLASFAVSDGEIAARIVPWVAGCLALLIFAKVMFGRFALASLPAVTAMAFSPTLICYSGEGKQYSADVLCAVVALYVGLRWIQFPTARNATQTAFFCAIVPWFSHTGVFFLPGVLLLAVVFRKQTGWPLTAGCAIGIAVSVLTLYWVNIRQVHGNSALNSFWQSDYVPWKAIAGDPTQLEALAVWALRKWWELVVRSPGLAPSVEPATIAWLGVAGITVAVSLLLWCVVRESRWPTNLVVAYAILPAVACLAAAAVEIYPFGNRLLLFSAPLVFFLLGHVHVTETWRRLRRYQIDLLFVSALLACPLASSWTNLAEWKSVANMFAPHCEQDIRPFVEQMRDAEQAQVGCYVFHAARPAYEFYSCDRTDNVVFGNPGDPDHHRDEIKACLALHPQCCFLYAHTAPWGSLEPQKAYDELMSLDATVSAPTHDDVRFFEVDTGQIQIPARSAAVEDVTERTTVADKERAAVEK